MMKLQATHKETIYLQQKESITIIIVPKYFSHDAMLKYIFFYLYFLNRKNMGLLSFFQGMHISLAKIQLLQHKVFSFSWQEVV